MGKKTELPPIRLFLNGKPATIEEIRKAMSIKLSNKPSAEKAS